MWQETLSHIVFQHTLALLAWSAAADLLCNVPESHESCQGGISPHPKTASTFQNSSKSKRYATCHTRFLGACYAPLTWSSTNGHNYPKCPALELPGGSASVTHLEKLWAKLSGENKGTGIVFQCWADPRGAPSCHWGTPILFIRYGFNFFFFFFYEYFCCQRVPWKDSANLNPPASQLVFLPALQQVKHPQTHSALGCRIHRSL